MTIEQEINEAVKKLQKCGDLFNKNRQRVAALGGAYASAAAESAAPKSKAIHYRYNTAKLTKKLRAPKGLVNKVASYTPGNLGRSINVLKFSRAKSKVFVGAKLARRATGNFSGRKTDGYYLHFSEEGTVKQTGTHWFHNSWERSKTRVFGIMKQEFERLGKNFENANAIK
jgi:HK97 gp10 family phage protein